jgi:hypothetical protein
MPNEMKTIVTILSTVCALLLSCGILQAAQVSVVTDTTNRYVIDERPVENFDGSQLAGKTIVSYEITKIDDDKTIIQVHTIRTKDTRMPTDPIYVIDGKKATKEDFENLNASAIESVSVVKGSNRDHYKNLSGVDIQQYEGWENGVILVKTKPVDPNAPKTVIVIQGGQKQTITVRSGEIKVIRSETK